MRHRLPGLTVITVGGELDVVTARPLEAFVREAYHPGDEVVFDLTGMTFMDASGLRVLLHAHDEARRDGSTVRLAAPQPGPARVITTTKVDTCVPVHASLEQALSIALAAAHAIGVASSQPESPAAHRPERT
jgi:anti-sigma B factor antagonist